MKTLVLDCETTISNKGNPFDTTNKLCYVGLYDGERSGFKNSLFDIEYSDRPYCDELLSIKSALAGCDLLVGFNVKFDLHWIKRYVPDIVFPPVFDCQLGEFLLSNQQSSYPSLDESCIHRGVGGKCGDVSTRYWNNGIDTPDIPESELRDYLTNDLEITYRLYQTLEPLLRNNKVFKIQCQDLLVLQEMEFNGMIFDSGEADLRSATLKQEIQYLDESLNSYYPNNPINWNSSDHISSVLFGGHIEFPARVSTSRILKNGTIKQGMKNGFDRVEFPRLITPEERNELTSKKGVYSVDKTILKSIKAKGIGKSPEGTKGKEIIDLLLRRTYLEKLLSTYFKGIPDIIQKSNWEPNIVHGRFNQCTAVTGRLSSAGPNLQNLAEEVKPLFKSRYEKILG